MFWLFSFVCGLTSVMPVAADQPASAKKGDWPMWGGSPDRNMVSDETGIPARWDVNTKKNIKWIAPLGTTTYGNPVVADGKIFVATNNGGGLRPNIKGDKGVIVCLSAATGQFLWQATHDKLPTGQAHDWPEQGIASTPWVAGERLYYVSNRCQLVCADVNGFLDGENDGPYRDEKHKQKQDADFVWVLDMFGELEVRPHNLANCSPVGWGDLVFVSTSNGVDAGHVKVPRPDAPDLIAVDTKTGQVVWTRSDPGGKVLHGQWSSPALGVVGGEPQLIFGGGDGWCYAYEPKTGKLLWKFDLNPKDSKWVPGGRGTRSSIIATPVVHDDKVFLAVGQDPEHGDGPGHLYAIDATKRGDITESGRLWHVGGDDFRRSLSTVAIADGLLYAADLNGFVYCLDAETGRRYWRHDTFAAVWGSPYVVEGKVLLGTEDGEVVVLEHGKTLKELATNDVGNAVYSTPVASHGVLYVTSRRALFAIEQPSSGDKRAAADPRSRAVPWPMFRGDPQLTGVAKSSLPEKLAVRWKFEAPEPISSSAAIVDGVVYVGCHDERLYALNLSDGSVKWRYQAAGPVLSSPLIVGGLVVFGDDEGVIQALDRADGRKQWTYATQGQVISSPNHQAGRVVVGSYDGFLYCLSVADGKEVWKYQTDGFVHGSPAIAGDRVLAVGCDERLHVVRLADGQAVRTVSIGSPSGASAAVRGSRAFVGTHGNRVLGVDWDAGRVVWAFEDPDRQFPFLASAAVTERSAITAGRDKQLRSLDATTGKLQWRFATGARVDSSPVVVGERVFVGSSDGNLYALDLHTGREVWRFETGAPITASPAVSTGCLVIGNEDGVLYCFGAAQPAGN